MTVMVIQNHTCRLSFHFIAIAKPSITTNATRLRLVTVIAAALFAMLSISTSGKAQTYEVGIQFSGMHLHKIDEGPFGIGARFHYNVTPLAAVDTELMHYPENPSGNFGETSALIGVRAGKHFNRFGVFGTARPGFIYFGGDYFRQRLDQKTHFMLDAGGMLEYYPNRHTFVRIEFSDAVIYYGSARLFNRANPDPLGTVHNFKSGLGIGVRF